MLWFKPSWGYCDWCQVEYAMVKFKPEDALIELELKMYWLSWRWVSWGWDEDWLVKIKLKISWSRLSPRCTKSKMHELRLSQICNG